MAWTYDVAALATSDLYKVRFMIGDTVLEDPLLQDEEIQFLITDMVSLVAAAIECCDRISSEYARQVDYTLGPHQIKASQRSEKYAALANKLKIKLNASSSVPLFTDPERTIFDIDMMNDSWCAHPDGED